MRGCKRLQRVCMQNCSVARVRFPPKKEVISCVSFSASRLRMVVEPSRLGSYRAEPSQAQPSRSPARLVSYRAEPSRAEPEGGSAWILSSQIRLIWWQNIGKIAVFNDIRKCKSLKTMNETLVSLLCLATVQSVPHVHVLV